MYMTFAMGHVIIRQQKLCNPQKRAGCITFGGKGGGVTRKNFRTSGEGVLRADYPAPWSKTEDPPLNGEIA
jgi:hypothetical protein